MATIKLQVAGIGYDGAPAGTGGDSFMADDAGSASDKVWYKISSGGGIGGALRELMSEKVKPAYLDSNSRSQLETLGVTYRSESEVRDAGMSNYLLWLVKDNGKIR
jgi:hypothetical protein